MFVKYPLRIYSMDENKFTKNKDEKEDIVIKLWIPASVLDSSSVPRVPPPLLRNLAFLFALFLDHLALGKAPTSYSIGFPSKFQKDSSFNDFTPPRCAGAPLETQARDLCAERQ